MTAAAPLDHRSLYRLPWSSSDNVLSWLEPTARCNLACEGCYRENVNEHKPLAEVRADLDTFARFRNFDGVSIAGGDPLLHPAIEEIVESIRTRGWKPIINTNGLALKPELLRRLARAGLHGLTFHIDSKQGRPGWRGKTEADLNQLRLYYAEMAASVGGLSCAFNSTVYQDTLDHVPDLVQWAQDHIDIVHTMVFIAYRQATSQTHDYYRGGEKIDPAKLKYVAPAEGQRGETRRPVERREQPRHGLDRQFGVREIEIRRRPGHDAIARLAQRGSHRAQRLATDAGDRGAVEPAARDQRRQRGEQVGPMFGGDVELPRLRRAGCGRRVAADPDQAAQRRTRAEQRLALAQETLEQARIAPRRARADHDDQVGAIARLRKRARDPAAILVGEQVAELGARIDVVDDRAAAIGQRHGRARAGDVGRESAEQRLRRGAQDCGGRGDRLGERGVAPGDARRGTQVVGARVAVAAQRAAVLENAYRAGAILDAQVVAEQSAERAGGRSGGDLRRCGLL